MELKHVHIYTDGSCLGNPGAGGYGALIKYKDKEKTLSGGFIKTTNNRMELLAAIEALNTLNQPCKVELYTDSQYVKDGINKWIHNWKKNGWRSAQKKPVKNADLWQKLDTATQKHHINWHWVKGHSGHIENDRVDELARDAATYRAENADKGFEG